MNAGDELSEFLASRRAKVSPEQAGLRSYGRRRVPGLRREEVASLAGGPSSQIGDGAHRGICRMAGERSRSRLPIAGSEEAASKDIGDWFRFEVGAPHTVRDGATGLRLPVTAYIGATQWASFHVDLVGPDITMTGEPENVPPLARVAMPEVEQHGYRAYPLVDHVADKVAATFDRYGDSAAPSTRYKDLVDLVAIVTEAPVDSDAQKTALASEAERRGITLPETFDVPARDVWERGYAAEAARSLLPIARTLEGKRSRLCGPSLTRC